MVKVGEMNDVGRTRDLCIAKGVLFYRGLGRHSNDHVFSFYAYAPGRLAIEYERNGRLLKDEEAWEVVMVGVSSFWEQGALGERPWGGT
jgi:hypothetical protein